MSPQFAFYYFCIAPLKALQPVVLNFQVNTILYLDAVYKKLEDNLFIELRKTLLFIIRLYCWFQKKQIPEQTEHTVVDVPKIVVNDEAELNLALRIRNKRKELNDIKFQFLKSRDSPQELAAELVGAGLVPDQDQDVVLQSLQKLVEDPQQGKSIVFPLAPSDAWPEPDQQRLVGYAQIKIIGWAFAALPQQLWGYE